MKKTLHRRLSVNPRVAGAWLFATLLVVGIATLYIYNERVADAQHDTTDQDWSLIVRSITPDDHVLGNRNAPIQMIVYSDLSCPFCSDLFANKIPRLRAEFGNTFVVVYRHLPLVSIHPRAEAEAEAAECAYQGGDQTTFWVFEKAVYAKPDYESGLSDTELREVARAAGANISVYDACIARGLGIVRVQKDATEAQVAGLAVTPSVVFKSAHRATVVQNEYYAQLESAIRYLLSEEKITP